MRVISQDRRYSFDFDRASFLRQENYISAIFAGENRYILIGRYETEERAEEVFEDMHKAYSDLPILVQNVDISDDLQQKLKEWELNAIVAKIPDECGKIEQIGNSVYYMTEE